MLYGININTGVMCTIVLASLPGYHFVLIFVWYIPVDHTPLIIGTTPCTTPGTTPGVQRNKGDVYVPAWAAIALQNSGP